jgi:hypothetical protein
MFAAIDSLIGLLIFVLISVVAGWLQKKQRKEQEEQGPAPPPRPRPTGAPMPPPGQHSTPKPLSWEEELKRLLEGNLPESEPPPAPPPPIVVQRPHRAPPPPIPAAPPPLPQHTHKSVFDVVEESNPAEVSVEPVFHPLPDLSESLLAHQRASQLEQQVQEHLRLVTQHPVRSAGLPHRAATPEATAALSLLRSPKSARTAVLAALILGPPRALSD